MSSELGEVRIRNLILAAEIAASIDDPAVRLTFVRAFYIRRYLRGREPSPAEEAEIADWSRFDPSE